MTLLKNIIFFFLTSTSSFAGNKELTLAVGESIQVSLRGSTIWVQDKKILAASAAGGILKIKGVNQGATILRVGKDVYEVQVLNSQNAINLKQFKKEVEAIIGLKMILEKGNIIVSGRLYRFTDAEILAQISQKLNIRYKLVAKMSPQTKKDFQNYVERILIASNLAPQTMTFEPSLEIHLNTKEVEAERYREIFEPYGISVIRDSQVIQVEPTIKVEITIAEVKRSLTLKYGLQGPTSYSAKILSTGEKELDDLPFNFSAFEGQGFGKILASPNLLCRSGEEAEFVAGGEFPIKIIKYRSQEVIWKKYGIHLKVKPVADSRGRMRLSIITEVTTIDTSKTIDDIPGLHTNKVSSHFDLTRSQTIALSGLVLKNEGLSSEGTPFISRIPILGGLFSSKQIQEDQTELVIFVRSSLFEANSENTKEYSQL